MKINPVVCVFFVLGGCFAQALFAAEATKAFNIPAGDAGTTLKKFSEQSGLSIMFAPDRVEGVVTREVVGELLPPSALEKLLAGTALVAVPTREPGAYAIRRAEAPGPNVQRAASTEVGDRPTNRQAATRKSETEEELLTLSPFEVREQNRGYYASNTMSGTRLNSRIEDLAASITVITKEQMQDFALLDMNDIFSYESGTEGLGNYTDYATSVNGAVTDNSSLDPLNANRIRGLGPANTSFGNFETSGRVPIDPIDIDAVEISRGPNSSIFGLGNTSGTVNSVPSSADLTKNRSQLTMRADSNEGFRTSLDLNRVLRKSTLAVRGSAVYQRATSHLKPSATDSVRLNGIVKFRPFKSTTLNAYFSDYRAHGRRANTQTPSDGVSVWLENGSPAFDPVTGVVTVNGRIVPLNANVLQGVGGNMGFYIDQGRLEYLAHMRSADVSNPTINVGNSVYREGGFRTLYTNQPLFATALPITDRSLYDWKEINLAAGNYFNTDAQTMRVTLDQVFLASPRQNLAAQVGWFREQVEQFSRASVGIPNEHGDNNSNPIFIDVNTRLLDGRTNPFFGRPWTKGAGPTKTAGVVVRPLRWLSLSANRSDSFRPAAPTQSLFLESLPHPNGVGKDYGVGVNLFDGKLVLRFNRYITRQLQTPNGPSGGVVNRIRRMDFEVFQAGTPAGTDTFTLERRATDWVVSAAAARGQILSGDQVLQQVAGILKLPVEYLRDPEYQIAAADDTLARGFEFEANYNPTPNLSVKLNVTEQEALNERIAPEVQRWLDERLPVWQSIIDPTTGRPWFTTNYGGSFTAEQFLAQNVTSQVRSLYVTEGLSRPQIRKYRANLIANYRLADLTEHRFLKRFNVGGAVRWEDKGAIGYFGVQQPPAIVTDLDRRRPIYDKAHAYFDLLLGYRTRLFSDKVNARFQLNVRNVHESGRLQPVAAFPDGTPYVFRIIEPRVFILSATFDL